MPYYPILVALEGKKVIVVGGGAVAERKIETLLECGAIVEVISQGLNSRLTSFLKEGKIRLASREFREDILEGGFMVIAATDDPSLNHRVSQMSRKKGILINVVDQPAESNFIVPSILRRGDLLIAVSTSGKSPALAKKVRERLEESFGGEYKSFLVLMGHLREKILARGLPQDENRQLFYDLVNSPLIDHMARNQWDQATAIINDILKTDLGPHDIKQYLKEE